MKSLLLSLALLNQVTILTPSSNENGVLFNNLVSYLEPTSDYPTFHKSIKELGIHFGIDPESLHRFVCNYCDVAEDFYRDEHIWKPVLQIRLLKMLVSDQMEVYKTKWLL